MTIGETMWSCAAFICFKAAFVNCQGMCVDMTTTTRHDHFMAAHMVMIAQ